MGYRAKSVYVPASDVYVIDGEGLTWTDTVLLEMPIRTRATGEGQVNFRCCVPLIGSDRYREGVKLISIDFYYSIETAGCDAGSFGCWVYRQPVLGVAGVPATVGIDISRDADHLTAAACCAVANHVLTVTLDEAEYLQTDSLYLLTMGFYTAETTAFTIYGARVNYEERE